MLKFLAKQNKNYFSRKLRTAQYYPVDYKYDGEVGYYKPDLELLKNKQYIKNQLFKEKMDQVQNHVIKNLRSKQKTQKMQQKRYGSFVKEIYEDLDFNPKTGFSTNKYFQQEHEIYQNLNKENFEELEQYFTQLFNIISCLNDKEFLQFQKHSIALKLSKNYKLQAKGILLESTMQNILKEKIDFDDEQKTNDLIDKIALQIVYNKIDKQIETKQGLKEEQFENQQLMLFLQDPFLKPNSAMIKTLIKQYYPYSYENIIDNDNEENSVENQIQKSYFKKRMEILCNYAGIDISRSIQIDKNDLQLNYGKILNQFTSAKQNQKTENQDQLILTLQEILGNSTLQLSLDDKILKLQQSTLTMNKELPSLQKISQQLETILYKLPQEFKEKYFSDQEFRDFSPNYLNKNYKEEELQWKVIDLEIPADIMPIEQYKQFQKDKNMSNILTELDIYGEQLKQSEFTKILKEDKEAEYYEHSDIQIDQKMEKLYHQAKQHFLHIKDKDSFLSHINGFIQGKNLSILKNKKIDQNKKKKIIINRFRLQTYDVFDDFFIDKDQYKFFHNRESAIMKENQNENPTNEYSPQQNSISFLDDNISDQVGFVENNPNELFKDYFRGNYINLKSTVNQKKVRKLLSNYVFGTTDSTLLTLHKGHIKYKKNIPIQSRNHKVEYDVEDYLEKEYEQNEIGELQSEFYDIDLQPDQQKKIKKHPELNDIYLEWMQNQYIFSERTTDINIVNDNYQSIFEQQTVQQLNYVSTTALQLYQDFNKQEYFKHYFQHALKDLRQIDYFNGNDNLSNEMNPNYGLFRSTIEKFQNPLQNNYSEQFIDNPKLNSIKPTQETTLIEFQKNYPDLFKKNSNLKQQDFQTSKIFTAKGTRKKSQAIAVLKIPGNGKITVNNREFIEYFEQPHQRVFAILGIFAINKTCRVDVEFFVKGGGNNGQSEACKVALGKCLIKAFPEYSQLLKGLKIDYTDPRKKEVKKISSWGARKSYTYVRR